MEQIGKIQPTYLLDHGLRQGLTHTDKDLEILGRSGIEKKHQMNGVGEVLGKRKGQMRAQGLSARPGPAISGEQWMTIEGFSHPMSITGSR